MPRRTPRWPLCLALLGGLLPAPGASAEDWYWRPYRESGPYGRGDGSTFANAWRSHAEVNWAQIRPGDTLYVCGLHDGGHGDNLLVVGQSGTALQPLTISGACPGSPGSIISTGRKLTTGWQGPDAGGAYWQAYGGNPFQVIDAQGYLARQSSFPTAGWPCRSYGFQDGRLYYKACGPPRTLYPGGASPVVLIRGRDHVTVTQLSIANGGRLVEVSDATGVRLLNLKLRYAAYGSIDLTGITAKGTIRFSEFSDVGNGPMARVTGPGSRHDGWVIDSNVIRNVYGTKDAHGIGWQAGSGNYLARNRIEDADGSGITFYLAGAGSRFSGNLIQENVISRVRDRGRGGAARRGIELTGGNCGRSANDTAGNLIRFNRISAVQDAGIYLKVPQPSNSKAFAAELMGNVINGARQGVLWYSGIVSTTPGNCYPADLTTGVGAPSFLLLGNEVRGVAESFVAPTVISRAAQTTDRSRIVATGNTYRGNGSWAWQAPGINCPGIQSSWASQCTVYSLADYQAVTGQEAGSVAGP